MGSSTDLILLLCECESWYLVLKQIFSYGPFLLLLFTLPGLLLFNFDYCLESAWKLLFLTD